MPEKIKKTTKKKRRLPDFNPDLFTEESTLLLQDQPERLCSVLFQGDFLNQKSISPDLSECEFRRVRFCGSVFEYGNLTDVVFSHCDFSNASFANTSFSRVEFRECKLTGAIFSKCLLNEVGMLGCQGELLSLIDCRLKLTELFDCTLKGLSLVSCQLSGRVFKNCKLPAMEINQTPCKDVDFSDSELSAWVLTDHVLRGATLSQEQAILYVRALGIQVV